MHAHRLENDFVIETGSPVETEQCAAEFARTLQAGSVVVLQGELGTGKTTFVRGACRELGIEGPVTSPTFTIGNIYASPGAGFEVAHLDLYRLRAADSEDAHLEEDYLTADRIGFVEWPDRSPTGVRGVSRVVELAHLGEQRRRITVRTCR